ncbi:MAG: histidinol dehydrogenase, partial [Rhodospirillaceae bacterium]|nr:histidinol dehydrogenase [Rhodospirillaceae bacterium]
MSVEYLKKASRRSTDDASDIRAAVLDILNRIEAGGDEAAKQYAARFDRYDGNIVLARDEIEAAAEQVPRKLKDDIRFAWDNVRRFAEAQKDTIRDMQIEISPGLIAGQKAIPCKAAGCYAPGGRYSHVASALMTVTTAKVAGCGHIAACSPPRPGI